MADDNTTTERLGRIEATLAGLATKADLAELATKADLAGVAKNVDVTALGRQLREMRDELRVTLCNGAAARSHVARRDRAAAGHGAAAARHSRSPACPGRAAAVMDAADKADILRRWSAFQRILGRPEHELTWRNCVRELDLDKRTRCLDCGTEDGVSYIVHNHVWAHDRARLR